MTYLFDAAIAFDRPLGAWDVSKVQSFYAIFQQVKAFNQPLSAWNT